MPWKDQSIVTIRKEFVIRASQEGVNMTALCRQYGISRKTGYKWRRRSATEDGVVTRHDDAGAFGRGAGAGDPHSTGSDATYRAGSRQARDDGSREVREDGVVTRDGGVAWRIVRRLTLGP